MPSPYSVVLYCLAGGQWLLANLVLVQCGSGALHAVLPGMVMNAPSAQAGHLKAPVLAMFQMPKVAPPSQWAGDALAGLKANWHLVGPPKRSSGKGIKPVEKQKQDQDQDQDQDQEEVPFKAKPKRSHKPDLTNYVYEPRDFLADYGHKLTKAQREYHEENGGCKMIQFEDDLCNTCCDYFDYGAIRGDEGACRCMVRFMAAELRGARELVVKENAKFKRDCKKLRFGTTDCENCCFDQMLRPFQELFGSRCHCAIHPPEFLEEAIKGIK